MFIALVLAAALAGGDFDRLLTYEKAWDESETAREPEARDEFAGKAEALVQHFLTENEGKPETGAYAFILRALGDVEATLALIAALPEPPPAKEGAIRRQTSEVVALLGVVLDAPAVGGDPRVAAALDRLAPADPDPPQIDVVRAAAITLLGRSRSSDAVAALVARADGDDPRLRSMAVQALGWMGERIPEAARPSVIAVLGKRLADDPDEETRFHAAEALRHLERAEGIPVLTAAIEQERSAAVIDAIVVSLEALGAPITDPARCRDLVARGYEAERLEPLFERWRASAKPEELVAAALGQPSPLRVLALRALVREPEKSPETTPLGQAEPPPTGPVEGLDDATVARLLDAAKDALGEDSSLSAHDAAIEAAWGFAKGNLDVLLPKVDEIRELPRRFFASWSIHRWTPAPYDRYRRNRELLAAGWVAVPFVLLMLFAPLRPYGLIGLLASVTWGATTYLSSGPLDLPPWPYPLAKVRFLLIASATVVAFVAVTAPSWRRFIAFVLAPFVFLGVYTVTRMQGFFPPDTLDGWIFVFEPGVGVALSSPLAYLLSLAGHLAGRSRERTTTSSLGRRRRR